MGSPQICSLWPKDQERSSLAAQKTYTQQPLYSADIIEKLASLTPRPSKIQWRAQTSTFRLLYGGTPHPKQGMLEEAKQGAGTSSMQFGSETPTLMETIQAAWTSTASRGCLFPLEWPQRRTSGGTGPFSMPRGYKGISPAPASVEIRWKTTIRCPQSGKYQQNLMSSNEPILLMSIIRDPEGSHAQQ